VAGGRAERKRLTRRGLSNHWTVAGENVDAAHRRGVERATRRLDAPRATGVSPVNHGQDARATSTAQAHQPGGRPRGHRSCGRGWAEGKRLTRRVLSNHWTVAGENVDAAHRRGVERATRRLEAPRATGVPPVNHGQDARATSTAQAHQTGRTDPARPPARDRSHRNELACREVSNHWTKAPRTTGVSPVNHGQDARATSDRDGACRSLPGLLSGAGTIFMRPVACPSRASFAWRVSHARSRAARP